MMILMDLDSSEIYQLEVEIYGQATINWKSVTPRKSGDVNLHLTNGTPVGRDR